MTKTETPVSRYSSHKDLVWVAKPKRTEDSESTLAADHLLAQSENSISGESKHISMTAPKHGTGKTGLVLDMAMSAALHKKGQELGYSEEEIEERLAKLDESVSAISIM